MTQEGYDRLRCELQDLTTINVPELADRLRDAREDGGDPAENGELMDALEERALLEQRIRALEARLAAARVADPASPNGIAGIGTRVGVRTRDGKVVHYELVGAGEADPARGRISISSPVGRVIAGRRAGHQLRVSTPRRRLRFELVSVEPLEPVLATAAAA
jgi:transcription elongation factor GreA